MKVLFLNAGNETGGGMVHILHILEYLKRVNERKFVLAVLEEGVMKERAEALGIETVCFASTKFPFLEKLKRYAEEENFTHIHTHGPRANVWMAALKEKLDCEWVVTVHSNPLVDFAHKGWYGKLLTQMNVRALKKADKIVTVCDAFQPVLNREGIDTQVMTTIHNGLSFEKSAQNIAGALQREDIGVADDALLFMQVARLEKVKAHEHALHAFSRFIKIVPYAKLVFVGGGSLAALLKRQVKELGIDQDVVFSGEREDVADLIQLADIILLTSVSEGFPYVLLEAAQAKKPIIATDVGDVGHLVQDNSGGWLVEAGSEFGVRQAMEEAANLSTKKTLKKRGDILHRFARNRFSLERCVEQLLEVYWK